MVMENGDVFFVVMFVWYVSGWFVLVLFGFCYFILDLIIMVVC